MAIEGSVLCAQAAISLENARLYQQAQQALHDLQQAQMQIVQSEKMSALGNLVAGVAHEINNVGKGTGLGLAIAHQIVVEKHGGTLQVDSEPGKGAVFTIWMPIKTRTKIS